MPWTGDPKRDEEIKEEGLWVLAFEYQEGEKAFTAWDRAQEEIKGFVGTGHTSVYRCLVQGEMTVIIIGEEPFSDQLGVIFHDICVEGKQTTIPSEIVVGLLNRRQSFRQSGKDLRVRHFRML